MFIVFSLLKMSGKVLECLPMVLFLLKVLYVHIYIYIYIIYNNNNNDNNDNNNKKKNICIHVYIYNHTYIYIYIYNWGYHSKIERTLLRKKQSPAVCPADLTFVMKGLE
jgi:hypothetical protein